MQKLQVEYTRAQAQAPLALSPSTPLTASQRNQIRTLASSLTQLGQILHEQEDVECIPTYEEAAGLLQRIGDQAGEAVVAFNLGHAYRRLPSVRDTGRAEKWYQRSLELRVGGDKPGKARCIGQLGLVAYKQFQEARAESQNEATPLQHLNQALTYTNQALALIPPDAVNELAVFHNQLGNIYDSAGQLDRALPHYDKSIRYKEMSGSQYGAGQTRYNVALGLAQANRLADARAYAVADLRDFHSFGNRAVADVQDTQHLLSLIEQALQQPS